MAMSSCHTRRSYFAERRGLIDVLELAACVEVPVIGSTTFDLWQVAHQSGRHLDRTSALHATVRSTCCVFLAHDFPNAHHALRKYSLVHTNSLRL